MASSKIMIWRISHLPVTFLTLKLLDDHYSSNWYILIWKELIIRILKFVYKWRLYMSLVWAAFTQAKFLCHISHALQSSLSDFSWIITVNLYSGTDTYEKWTNKNYRYGINDCRACNLLQRKFGRVLEPLYFYSKWVTTTTTKLNKNAKVLFYL